MRPPSSDRFRTVALSIALTLLAADVAQAEDPGARVPVPRHDLDLASEQGARVFNERLNRAARDACGFSYVSGTARIDNLSCRLRLIELELTEVLAEQGAVHPLLGRRLAQVRRPRTAEADSASCGALRSGDTAP